MQEQLTITINEQVYEGLHRVIGRRNIERRYPSEAYVLLNQSNTRH